MKVSVLGGDCMGHGEQRIAHEHVSNSEWLARLSSESTCAKLSE
jgi:hypothetical protein